jgi:hypothetical protein
MRNSRLLVFALCGMTVSPIAAVVRQYYSKLLTMLCYCSVNGMTMLASWLLIALNRLRIARAVAVQEVSWDYAPSGYNNFDNTTIGSMDGMTAMPSMPSMPMSGSGMSSMPMNGSGMSNMPMNGSGMSNMPMNGSDNMMYTKFKKAQYFEFTDATFTTVKPTPEWQGNVGPTLRAEVEQLSLTWRTS